jgi:hypothetical protein
MHFFGWAIALAFVMVIHDNNPHHRKNNHIFLIQINLELSNMRHTGQNNEL